MYGLLLGYPSEKEGGMQTHEASIKAMIS